MEVLSVFVILAMKEMMLVSVRLPAPCSTLFMIYYCALQILMSVLWEIICANKLAPIHLEATFAAVTKATMKMETVVEVCCSITSDFWFE